MKMTDQLAEVARCPHCSVARPTLAVRWRSDPIPRGDGQPPSRWAVYACSTCGSLVTAKGAPNTPQNQLPDVVALFPSPQEAHVDLPERARRYLQQAYETLHAPDAAAMIAGSAVDAMLKQLGLTEGSLYSRIDEAVTKNLLTQGMADWAHAVRLGSNRPRHADEEEPHVTPDEARRAVEFAEALGQFLFVLTAKIERGIQAAEEAGA